MKDRICGNKWFPLVFLPIAAVFVLFFSTSTSPFYDNEGFDSMLFKQMGLAVLQGKIPYVDLFEHKGPIIFYINALGQWIVPGRTGILLVQFMFMSFTLVLWWKTIRLFLRPFVSFVTVLCLLALLIGFYALGNQCEEYMMPFACGALYISLKHLFSERKSLRNTDSLLLGLCFGFLFFVRPNDAVSQVGGLVFGLGILLVMDGGYKTLLRNALSFIAGSALIALPILAWFGHHGALEDMYYGMVTHNSYYAGGFAAFIKPCFGKKLFLLPLFFMTLLLARDLNKRLFLLLLPVEILSYLWIGVKLGDHYFMPWMASLFLLLFSLTLQRKEKRIWIITLLFLHSGLRDVHSYCQKDYLEATFSIIQNDFRLIGHKKNVILMQEGNRLLKKIPLSERHEIWNYSIRSPFLSVLWRNGLVQGNFIPASAMLLKDESGRLRKKNDIQIQKPKWLLLETYTYFKYNVPTSMWKSDSLYIEQHYELVGRTDSRCGEDVSLYRRKD